VKAPTEALVQQIEGFGKLPKLSPDNDDALIAYGKLSTVSDEALKALEQLVQACTVTPRPHMPAVLLLVMLGRRHAGTDAGDPVRPGRAAPAAPQPGRRTRTRAGADAARGPWRPQPDRRAATRVAHAA
jgi:hypothetical protein